MGRAKSYFSPDAEIAEEINFMFAVVRGPALSDGMQATAYIKPQSVLVYQVKICEKSWNRDNSREIFIFHYLPLLR
jgi:hypothetical protein